MSAVTGWGRSTWGSGAWNEAAPVEVTGVAGTAAVGSVSITEGAGVTVSVTGLSATGSVGSVTVAGAASDSALLPQSELPLFLFLVFLARAALVLLRLRVLRM